MIGSTASLGSHVKPQGLERNGTVSLSDPCPRSRTLALAPPRTRAHALLLLAQVSSSPSGRARAEKVEYELWLEAQKRSAAERELRQVRIHGRSRPPWVGNAAASGYRDLAPAR